MRDEAIDDWQSGELILVPLAWREDELWSQIQAAAQERISTNLQTIYSDMLRQPLSPLLLDMACKIERRHDAS